MRRWTADISDISSALAVYSPPNFKNWSDTYTDNYTDNAGYASVPASSPYKRVLDFRPKRLTISITLAGVAATLIEWGSAPSAGCVAVNYITGEVEFNSADAGKAVVAIYKHWGSVLDADAANRMGRALQATTTLLATGGVERTLATVTGINAKTVGNTTLWTVDAAAVILGAVVRCTAASVITTGATAGVGVNTEADDIFTSMAMPFLTDTSGALAAFVFAAMGQGRFVVAAADVVKFGIDVAAVGTSQTLAVDLRGYYL